MKTPFYLVDRIGSIILAMYEFTIWPPVTLHIASSSSSVYFYFFVVEGVSISIVEIMVIN